MRHGGKILTVLLASLFWGLSGVVAAAEGDPMMFPFGPAYTQHVYIVPTSRTGAR